MLSCALALLALTTVIPCLSLPPPPTNPTKPPFAPPAGPFPTNVTTFTVAHMDSTNQKIDVYYPHVPPSDPNSRTFPLISYAHGMAGGGFDAISYKPLMLDLASYGFVLVLARACNIGCGGTCSSLPDDPPCFGDFYLEQLKALEWAKNQSTNPTNPQAHAIFKTINHKVGYGIGGHSMGGQATLFSSSYNNATQHNIKCAVFHHPYTHQYPAPHVPFLAFTGTWDVVAPPDMVHQFFDNAAKAGTAPNRGLVNKKDATHVEPLWWPSVPKLAKFSAAWFKIHLEQVDKQDGIDYNDLIYGSSNTSLCGGGDGAMEECIVTPRQSVPPPPPSLSPPSLSLPPPPSSPPPPPPTTTAIAPPRLLASLSANVTVRSASQYGPIYSTSLVHADATTGSYLSTTTSYIPAPTTASYYLRLCNQNISYYFDSGQNCTARRPLPGQCQCLTRNAAGLCTEWSPSLSSPSTIPPTATYGGSSKVNGLKNASEWTYFFPPFSSTIEVWTVPVNRNESFVTRTIGARVQTDYIDVKPGPPDASVFDVPQQCM